MQFTSMSAYLHVRSPTMQTCLAIDIRICIYTTANAKGLVLHSKWNVIKWKLGQFRASFVSEGWWEMSRHQLQQVPERSPCTRI